MQGISRISAIRGKTVPKSPMIRGGSRKIPYAAEQGINSAHQGIKVPCSAENRDISRLMRRLVRRFSTGKHRWKSSEEPKRTQPNRYRSVDRLISAGVASMIGEGAPGGDRDAITSSRSEGGSPDSVPRGTTQPGFASRAARRSSGANDRESFEPHSAAPPRSRPASQRRPNRRRASPSHGAACRRGPPRTGAGTGRRARARASRKDATTTGRAGPRR